MLQLLPQSNLLTINTSNPHDAVNYINEYIEKYHCKEMEIDLSKMNIPDACHVSTLCGANHFIKYPDGRINWKVSSSLVKEFTSSLNLGNNEFTY